MLDKIPNSIKVKLINIPLMITLIMGYSSFALAKDKSEELSKTKSCYYELDNYNKQFMNISIEDGMENVHNLRLSVGLVTN